MKGSHHFTEETDMHQPNGERRKLQRAGMRENISFSFSQNYEGKTQELKPNLVPQDNNVLLFTCIF